MYLVCASPRSGLHPDLESSPMLSGCAIHDVVAPIVAVAINNNVKVNDNVKVNVRRAESAFARLSDPVVRSGCWRCEPPGGAPGASVDRSAGPRRPSAASR
jgi:hypothetical protein